MVVISKGKGREEELADKGIRDETGYDTGESTTNKHRQKINLRKEEGPFVLKNQNKRRKDNETEISIKEEI